MLVLGLVAYLLWCDAPLGKELDEHPRRIERSLYGHFISIPSAFSKFYQSLFFLDHLFAITTLDIMAVNMPDLFGYTAMPAMVTLPFEDWEEWIKQTCPESFGIAWQFIRSSPTDSYAYCNIAYDNARTKDSRQTLGAN